MLQEERAEDPPDPRPENRQSDLPAEPACELAACDASDEANAVEARPTPLPHVDGALLGLSVQLLAQVRPAARNFCPPPAPPAWRHATWTAFAEPAGPDDVLPLEDSISLMERIEGVSRPIGSRPSPAYAASRDGGGLRAYRRTLLGLGIAAGVVHCMVLALVLSTPEPRAVEADEPAPALTSAPPASGSERDEVRGSGAVGRAGVVDFVPAASATPRIEHAAHTRGKRHRAAAVHGTNHRRRHATAMR